MNVNQDKGPDSINSKLLISISFSLYTSDLDHGK
uniref:Uncharacterized protein n=1 Tax=Rhizophora mucronata TaxID=61149 RepID=A0A2P2PE13_RHIMU